MHGGEAGSPTDAPPDPAGRIAALDIIRGFAVMGIVIMNIQSFALPVSDYVTPVGPLSQMPADRWVWAVELLLFDGKMRGLFTLLFGAGCLLILDRAEQKGRSELQVHVPRMLWLALFGLAHYLLLWWGDILFFYGLCGLFLYPLRKLRPHALWTVALMLFALDFLFSASVGLTLWIEPATLGDSAGKVESALAYDPKAYAAEIVRMQGAWAGQFLHRLDQLGDHVLSFFDLAPGFLCNMLVGMALFRSGFLTGSLDARVYRKVAGVSFGVSLCGGAGVISLLVGTGFDPNMNFLAYFALLVPFQLLMAVGWAALIVLLVKRKAEMSPFLDRVAATGRSAFTNYLVTTIAMTAVFQGWGLGLFGTVPRHVLPLFAVASWLLMLAWSKPWLERFHYGPFEWLWRSLSRLQVQPMRKQPER